MVEKKNKILDTIADLTLSMHA